MNNFFESSTDIKMSCALALTALAVVLATFAAQPEGTAAGTKTADAQASASVIHRRTSLSNKVVMNKIHEILPKVDYTPYPKLHPVLLNSAFLEPSSGGFRAKCNDPLVNTFRYYEINTSYQAYKKCGPGAPWPDKAKLNEFKRPLNRLGNMIIAKVRVPATVKLNGIQDVNSVRATRSKITASYKCPAPTQNATPSVASSEPGVSKITKRGKWASIFPC